MNVYKGQVYTHGIRKTDTHFLLLLFYPNKLYVVTWTYRYSLLAFLFYIHLKLVRKVNKIQCTYKKSISQTHTPDSSPTVKMLSSHRQRHCSADCCWRQHGEQCFCTEMWNTLHMHMFIKRSAKHRSTVEPSRLIIRYCWQEAPRMDGLLLGGRLWHCLEGKGHEKKDRRKERQRQRGSAEGTSNDIEITCKNKHLQLLSAHPRLQQQQLGESRLFTFPQPTHLRSRWCVGVIVYMLSHTHSLTLQLPLCFKVRMEVILTGIKPERPGPMFVQRHTALFLWVCCINMSTFRKEKNQ